VGQKNGHSVYSSLNTNRFLPHDASAERGYEIAFVCPTVRPSVRP